MEKKHEQSIADKVKMYNEKRKQGLPADPPKAAAPNFSQLAVSTWQDPSSQQWFYVEVEYDPNSKEARVKTVQHTPQGKSEAREHFKINAAKLGLV